MALSVTAIKNAKPTDKPFKLYDEAGLFIQITPAGGKWWRFKYRYDGKEKLLSLGTFPDVSLADARNRRDDARKLLAQIPPIDPSNTRKAINAANTLNAENSFEALAREWLATYMADKSETHTGRILRRFELYLFPWIGTRPIGEITAPEILIPIKLVQNQNKLETAHRTLQATGQVFRYAVQSGRAIRDVTTDLRGALPPATINHMTAFTEPKDVAELLRAIEGFTGTFTVQSALKLAHLFS